MMIRRQFFLFALFGVALSSSWLFAADEKKGDDKKFPKVYLDITADGKKLGAHRGRVAKRSGAQNGREFSRIMHRRKRIWL